LSDQNEKKVARRLFEYLEEAVSSFQAQVLDALDDVDLLWGFHGRVEGLLV
jgi:hypothetical protein